MDFLNTSSNDANLHCILRQPKFDQDQFYVSLSKQSDINTKDEFGQTALHIAISNSNVTREAIEVLLKNQADPNMPDSDGNTPLHVAMINSSNNPNFRTISHDLLLFYGANPRQTNKLGYTSLHYAIVCPSDTEIGSTVAALLHCGADPNSTVSYGNDRYTPLSLIVSKLTLYLSNRSLSLLSDVIHAMEQLLKAGANPTALIYHTDFLYFLKNLPSVIQDLEARQRVAATLLAAGVDLVEENIIKYSQEIKMDHVFGSKTIAQMKENLLNFLQIQFKKSSKHSLHMSFEASTIRLRTLYALPTAIELAKTAETLVAASRSSAGQSKSFSMESMTGYFSKKVGKYLGDEFELNGTVQQIQDNAQIHAFNKQAIDTLISKHSLNKEESSSLFFACTGNRKFWEKFSEERFTIDWKHCSSNLAERFDSVQKAVRFER